MVSELQVLKKKLDAIFSKYVRLYHSTAGGVCTCYTCGRLYDWKRIQNGHYIPRNILISRFDVDNCRPQCAGCNLFGNGRFIDFRNHLSDELGEDRVKELELNKYKTFKVDEVWYKDQIAHYTAEVKRLLKKKGL